MYCDLGALALFFIAFNQNKPASELVIDPDKQRKAIKTALWACLGVIAFFAVLITIVLNMSW